jgi:hypothetical protein
MLQIAASVAVPKLLMYEYIQAILCSEEYMSVWEHSWVSAVIIFLARISAVVGVS